MHSFCQDRFQLFCIILWGFSRSLLTLPWLDLNEFQNEIFPTSRMDHQNIVNLLGYCTPENGEGMLLNDYMAQANLFDHLFKSGNSSLSWKQRLQICIDAAKGLEYLHTGCEYPIIHRDVKPTTILPPMVKVMSDVYSFGVVLFEVLCGMPAIYMSSSLASRVELYLKQGKLEEIIDPNLNGQIDPGCFKIFTETAIACLNLRGNDRPAMIDVLHNLELAMEAPSSW